jgi:uncharacterized protein (DUF736 family)
MAQIGTFTPAEDGSFTGRIKTLSLNVKARLLPPEPSQEREDSPNLRVMVGNLEIRAAWQRTSKENTIYHSGQAQRSVLPGADLRQPRRGR